MPVQLNPKGSPQHDHTKRGKIIASRDGMEYLLGAPHSEADGMLSSAEWYLVTPHGSARIYNHWAFGEDEYGIDAANDRVTALVVDYFRENRLQAYSLQGEL